MTMQLIIIIYCQVQDHNPSECAKITSETERREFLATKRLCFNCTGWHKLSPCKSTVTCQHRGKRNHTSICSSPKEVKTKGVHKPENKEIVYPIIFVEINGIKPHAILDTGAGSLYALNKLINLLKKRLRETWTKRMT